MMDHTSWMDVVTSIDRPKLVGNRSFVAVLCCQLFVEFSVDRDSLSS